MPPPANTEEFVDFIRKSGLIGEDQLGPALQRISPDPTTQSVDDLANALVRDGILTRFQSKQLKLGRFKRFMVAGKYRLLELIGVGGMGAVYLCEHVFMRRLVAVKVLPLEKLSDPSNLERFYREARAVAALDHPNIVRAHDIDKADGLHFLVMEYVDGTSIQEIVARFGPMDPIRAAHYVAQSAIGLQHASELGMVHRDVKPGNLLLDRTGVIKILDMGLARFFHDKNDNLTAKYDEKCVLGTADYLAPEQALSNIVDIRADIYALGGTFYFMLTGQSPVPEGTIAQKLVFHQTQEPRPVQELRADVPAGILDVLQKMLRKKPEDRYAEPVDVAEALAEWTEIPMSAPPEHEMPDLCRAVLAVAGVSDRPRNSSHRPNPRTLARPAGSSNRYAPAAETSTISEAPTYTSTGFPPPIDVPVGPLFPPVPTPPPPRVGNESIDLLAPQEGEQTIQDSSIGLGRPNRRPRNGISWWLVAAVVLGGAAFAGLAFAIAWSS